MRNSDMHFAAGSHGSAKVPGLRSAKSGLSEGGK